MAKKILLIEDDDSVGRTLQQGLQMYGYQIFATNRGDEGLMLAVTESPDLILLGMDVTVVNGWQAIKILKTSRSTWLIPTIAIAERTIDGELLLQAGFDAYYRKPISLKHLLVRIEALIGASDSDGPPEQTSMSSSTPQRLDVSTTLGSRSEVPTPVAAPHPQMSDQLAGNCPKSRLDSSTQATVVYIDDSPADSQAMGKIIERAGYKYANISDSLQALPKLLELKPQLIFLDLVMPIANGYELCAQIRRVSAFRQTPIIIVTNNDGIADRVRARVVGASGFFGKPIREQRVLKILKKHLPAHHRYQPNGDYHRGISFSL